MTILLVVAGISASTVFEATSAAQAANEPSVCVVMCANSTGDEVQVERNSWDVQNPGSGSNEPGRGVEDETGHTPTTDGAAAETLPWAPGKVYAELPERCNDTLSPLSCVVRPRADAPPGTTPPPQTAAVTYPTVYAHDLVSFRPNAPTFVAEPNGAGLIGKPVNFVASAADHELSGTLLGFPATVHFAPMTYTFVYGDGATLSSADGGATWASTGSPQFTETATSHVYGERGTYGTSSSVAYAAWVNFGDGLWRPVIGEVTAAGPARDVRVYEPKSALVGQDCNANPSAPGC